MLDDVKVIAKWNYANNIFSQFTCSLLIMGVLKKWIVSSCNFDNERDELVLRSQEKFPNKKWNCQSICIIWFGPFCRILCV